LFCALERKPIVLLLPLCSLLNVLLQQNNRADLALHLNKPKPTHVVANLSEFYPS